MKRRDIAIVSLIALNFAWFGWKVYAASHVPVRSVIMVTAKEVIGNVSNLSGDPSAKYVIVEFGDYQCPPCARMFAQIEEYTLLNPGKFRFQFRQYPLPGHSLAFPAALLAERARKSGKFEEVHRSLYEMGAKLNESTLISLADHYGLTYVSADTLGAKDKEFEAIIDNDKLAANKIPVTGTPSLFLCTPDQKVYQLNDIHQAADLMN